MSRHRFWIWNSLVSSLKVIVFLNILRDHRLNNTVENPQHRLDISGVEEWYVIIVIDNDVHILDWLKTYDKVNEI